MKAGMKVVMEGAGRQRRQGPGQEAWNEATECQLIYNVIDS